MTTVNQSIAAVVFSSVLFVVSVGLFALGGGIQWTSLGEANAVTSDSTYNAAR